MTPVMRFFVVHYLMATIVIRVTPVMVMIDHHNLAARPVETAEIESRRNLNTNAPGKTAMHRITYRHMPIDGRIATPPPGSIHNLWVVIRQIHHLR